MPRLWPPRWRLSSCPTMSDSVPQSSFNSIHPTSEIPQSGRGVLCPDCNRLNPADRESCKYCSRPLFVGCSKCSATNERVLSQCRQCGHSLQRGLFSGLLGSEPEAVSVTSRWDGDPSGPMGKGTLCCKCEHLNPIDRERCERCSEVLFLDCPKCQKRNARVLMHCASCRGRLHRKTQHETPHRELPRTEEKSSGSSARSSGHSPVSTEPVVCAKCTHLNPAGLQRCEQCRGHLFVVCRDCETTNARSEPRCLKCNRRLHRSINERLDPLGAKNVSMKWVYVMAAVLLLSLAGFILVQFSGFRIFE